MKVFTVPAESILPTVRVPAQKVVNKGYVKKLAPRHFQSASRTKHAVPVGVASRIDARGY